MSERFCGVAFIVPEDVAVDAFNGLTVTDLLLLLQDGTRFGVVAHTAGAEVTRYENIAITLSRAVQRAAVVQSCSTSGYSDYQLFEDGRATDGGTFSELEDDSQIYSDIGISRRELSELFLGFSVPRSVNPLGMLPAVRIMESSGSQGAGISSRLIRHVELADRLISNSEYSAASNLLNDLETQTKSLSRNRSVMFLRSLIAFHQSALCKLS